MPVLPGYGHPVVNQFLEAGIYDLVYEVNALQLDPS